MGYRRNFQGLRLFVVASCTVAAGFAAGPVSAADEVKIVLKQSDIDQRATYKVELLKALLEATRGKFGAYNILPTKKVPRARALELMVQGETLNVYYAPADVDWERRVTPIRIPVRRGLLNYRLLLINRTGLDSFVRIDNADDLKRMSVGLRMHWTTTKVMKALGYKIVPSNTYDTLFSMLQQRRYDFSPRGVNEIFGELEARRDEAPDLMIEPRLALFMPMPVYLYVSPKHPRLAERLRSGFAVIMANGVFETLFAKYFSDQISRANLEDRYIINVGNPLLSKATPLGNKALWFYPIPE